MENQGERLAKVISVLNTNQKELAKELGITSQTVLSYTKGRRTISGKVASQLQSLYNISSNWLLCGEGAMFLPTKGKTNETPILKKVRKSGKQLQKERRERLKNLISELGITQREFAESLKVTYTTINMLYNGRNTLSEIMATRIGLKYGINPNWLLTGEGNKFVNDDNSLEVRKAEAGKIISRLKQSIAIAVDELHSMLDDLEQLEHVFE